MWTQVYFAEVTIPDRPFPSSEDPIGAVSRDRYLQQRARKEV